MTRFENWPSLLSRFASDWQGKKHVWGKSDCSIMCLDWVERATGQAVGDDVAGSYDSAAGALQFLSSLGYADLPEMVTDRLKTESKEGNFLQRGDIALVDCPAVGDGLGVVLGTQILIMDVKQGGAVIPLTRSLLGWKV